MNVSCPQCSTVYRVDPAKVPAGGVRARCSTCSGVIAVGLQGAAPRLTPPRATPSRPPPFVELGAALPPLRPTPRTSWPEVGVPSPGAASSSFPEPTSAEQAAVPALAPTTSIPAISVPAMTPPPASPIPSPAHPAAGSFSSPSPGPASPGPGEHRPINPFLTRDPSLRAKRLARALVSDMVAYYPAKHSEGLENGTLKELFRDEIKKSYEEYIAQVGADFARSTTHFQESLNEVLGAGKRIF